MNLICLLDVNENEYLIKHFIKYYSQIGVNNFMFVLNYKNKDILKFTNIFKLLTDNKCNVVDTILGEIDFYKHQNYVDNELRKKVLKTEEWCILADIDEFVELSKNFICSLNENTHFDYVEGVFVDKIAKNGNLTEIKEEEDLFEQYPLKTNISKDICKAIYSKIPLLKTKVNVTAGHHWIESNTEDKLEKYEKIIDVSHFKWNADLLRKIEQRIKDNSAPDRNTKWMEENKLLLNYFKRNDKKIILKS